MNYKKINIAIDGPAASGKSSIGKRLAEEIKYNFFDTGLMYRAFTYYCLKNMINLNNNNEIKKQLNNFKFSIKNQKIFLDNKEISLDILKNQTIVDNINKLTSLDFVREKMVSLQRNIAKNKGFIMVGRDISTIVLPNAEIKIFLTASLNERAKRRFEEIENNDNITIDLIRKKLFKRDDADKNRKIGPLKMDKNSILINNTNMNISETINKIKKIINKEIKNEQ